MARYHVRADGSMGVCTAKEGNCPFGDEEGTRHFTSKSEAQRYSEGRNAADRKSLKHTRTMPVEEARAIVTGTMEGFGVSKDPTDPDERGYTFEDGALVMIGAEDDNGDRTEYRINLDGVKSDKDLKERLRIELGSFDAVEQMDKDGAFITVKGERHYQDEILSVYQDDEAWMHELAELI